MTFLVVLAYIHYAHKKILNVRDKVSPLYSSLRLPHCQQPLLHLSLRLLK